MCPEADGDGGDDNADIGKDARERRGEDALRAMISGGGRDECTFAVDTHGDDDDDGDAAPADGDEGFDWKGEAEGVANAKGDSGAGDCDGDCDGDVLSARGLALLLRLLVIPRSAVPALCFGPALMPLEVCFLVCLSFLL